MITEEQDTAKRIRAYQVEQLYTRFPTVGWLSLGILTVLVIIQWRVIKPWILLVWWGVMVVIYAARLYLVSLYRRDKPSPAAIEPWATRFLIGVVCASLGWGAAGVFLFSPQDVASQLVLVLIIAGMSSTGLAALTSVREDIIAFLCCMLIPPIVRLTFMGTTMYMIMSGLILVYLIALLLTSRHMTNTIKELLTLRIKSMQQTVIIQESEERYRDLFENATDLIQSITPEGQFIYANQAWKETLGYSEKEVPGTSVFDIIHPDHRTHFREIIQSLTSGEKIGKVETVFVAKSGEKVIVEGSVSSRFKDDKPISIRGIFRDITERKHAEEVRKRSEEQIKDSLAEKEVLLKEIHHRVKNNLQIISSLLNLQSGYIKDKETLEVFKNSQERIMAMALVHEKLYQSKDLSKIDFREYIHNLIVNLFESYYLKREQVQLKMQIEDVTLDIETSIPLGLIINELVSNSLKHAFPAHRNGELRIILSKTNDEKYDYTLTIGDNGVGFPEGLEFQNSGGLGMMLVNALVKKLKGVIEMDNKNGTTFTLKFKKLK